jgi:transcriptional regulator with XRE-family HTH domain
MTLRGACREAGRPRAAHGASDPIRAWLGKRATVRAGRVRLAGCPAISRSEVATAMLPVMPTREDPADRARRMARRDLRELVGDLRASRIALGLSQADVARAAGISRQLLGRLERDELGRTSWQHLAAIAGVLGLRLRIGSYPDGEHVRDHVQLRLLDALRTRLHPSLSWRTEVPLPIAEDRRAWDAMAIGADGWTAIEGISRIGAVDATVRRAKLKQRDDPRVASLVLVVNDTTRNRDALRAALSSVRADFPLGTRDVIAALGAGHAPSGNGIVLLRAPAPPIRPQAVHIGGKVVDGRRAVTRTFVDKPVGAPGPSP